MIRTKEFSASPELKKAWDDTIAPIVDAALAEFRTWPLLERVGETWPDAPPRCLRVAGIAAVGKALKSNETDRLWKAANPGLQAMYYNHSDVLNVRSDYFYRKLWEPRVQRVVVKATATALKKLYQRLGWKPGKSDEGYLEHRPDNCLREHAWERLHSDAVEAPFHEHSLTILRAGHYPAGLQGQDWKTCRFLYF